MTETKSINDKITDLNAKVQWFYSDDFSLDSASKNYKEAVTLAREIETDLDSLKNEIKIIDKDFTK